MNNWKHLYSRTSYGINMRKQILILPIFFLFLLTFVASAPWDSGETIIQISTGDNTLELIYPKDPYYKINEPFTVHIHALNSSGTALTNDEFDCQGHFYDTQSNHLLDIFSVPEGIYDEDFNINTTLTNSIGTKPYNIYCNSTTESGFISGLFFITEDSEEKSTTGNGLLIAIILIPLILALLLIVGAGFLGEAHGVLKLVSYLLVIPFTWVSFHFGMIGLVKYNGLIELQTAIGTTTYWLGWLFFTIIFYVLIYIVYTAFTQASQNKKARLEY